MKIIYMGTPEFAIAPLEAVLDHGYDVVAVVTAPDKPAGRGKNLTPPPVKSYALEKGLKVLQPEKLKDPLFIEQIRSLRPDVQVVVAFRMLPESVWSVPPLGTFNLHASLLPQYRGAAPINHAIMNGETETGLTTFFIDDKIDTGQILLREKISLGKNENAGQLHDRLMKAGAGLVIKTLQGIREKTLEPVNQESFSRPGDELKTAPKIFTSDCRINWDRDSGSLHNFIRGLSPYPAAFSWLITRNERIHIKIFESLPVRENHEFQTGKIFSDGKNYLRVAAKDGFIDILEIQAAGKRKMKIREFLAGFKEKDTAYFES